MGDVTEDTEKFTKLEICNALSNRFCKNCNSPCSICKIQEAIVTIVRMKKENQTDE